jgi:uncharacterized protein YdhG (YjbR/CyaY superfamily)
MSGTPADVESYLAALPGPTREVVEQMRAAIHAAVPGLDESISYGIPTFSAGGRRIVHVAGWAHHVSMYPVPGDPDLAEALAPYLAGRGTLKFALGSPVPYDLVGRVAAALAASDQG